jgi:choline dehydrogenase-like flavoprotein
MKSNNSFDVIIIGTGAGGGTLAYHLAPSGKRILLLERGDYVPREKPNWEPLAVDVEGRYQTKETWKATDGTELHPHTNYWVGGNTKFYGAAVFRLRKEDFGEIRHHGGVSPAGRSRTRVSSPITPGRSSSTRCTASGARIRPNLLPALRTLTPRSATSRGSGSSARTSPAWA